MSTQNIPFSILKKKITLKYPESAAMGFFQEIQERVRNSRGRRAINVQATEVLYTFPLSGSELFKENNFFSLTSFWKGFFV